MLFQSFELSFGIFKKSDLFDVKTSDELFSSGQDEEAMIALTSAEDAYNEAVRLSN
jgi:hypothetical protein